MPNTHLDTARWTSPAYAIKFAQIDRVTTPDAHESPFRLSAWGMSAGLRTLLADFTDSEINQAVQWLTSYQNEHLIYMLEKAHRDEGLDRMMPSLDHLFIAIDAELYLPRGMRIVVTCVTNIVPFDNEDIHDLDKFIAVLDPGEVNHYIRERRGMNLQSHVKHVH
ncbi:MAG: hypothetical protein AAF126_24060 [Chloroflexota bacterium]